MQPGTLVIPFGTGIGDFVNMRPLLAAIRDHIPDEQVAVLCPEDLGWLVPCGISVRSDSRLLAMWRRFPAHGRTASAISRLSVAQVGTAAAKMPHRSLAAGLSWYVKTSGSRPLSLLEMFSGLDLSLRWTPGPWNPPRRHVIDLLSEALASRGILVPHELRRPHLHVEARKVPIDVLVHTGAGSSLKEAPLALWLDVVRQLYLRGRTVTVTRIPTSRQAETAFPSIVSLAEAGSVRDLAALVASSRLVISPDTGVLHLAGALRRPWVGLFGSTDPVFLGPYHSLGGRAVVSPAHHEEVCRTCWAAQSFPAVRCPIYSPPSCLSTISTQDVLDAVDQVEQSRSA